MNFQISVFCVIKLKSRRKKALKNEEQKYLAIEIFF